MRIKAGVLCFSLLLSITLKAQELTFASKYLFKPVSIEANNERLEDVLQMLGKKGDFYFSYNSNLINKDSIISVSIQNAPVKEVLDQVLQGQFEYKESANYIILRPAFYQLTITPETINSGEKMYHINGYIIDEKTGATIKNASVFEKRLLKSTLTDDNGYFSLKFKGDHKSVTLTVSKENYRDTTIQFLSTLNITPRGYASSGDSGYGVADSVERSGIGKFLVSSRQRIQSLNIAGFLANSPVQASLIPGVSTHGMLSSQLVNKASYNLIGGYTAGVDGVEVAGVFNINKRNMRYCQLAGVANLVGGSVTGVQLAGVSNTVLDEVKGVQVSGVSNLAGGKVRGVQASGVISGVKKGIDGVQVSGAINYSHENTSGVQAAGAINLVNGNFEGVQIGGAVNLIRQRVDGVQIGTLNYAKKLRGVQIGLINVADSSAGYSIGLINWVNKGYHKVSISANDVMNTNLSLKTGNSKLYTHYIFGMNASNHEKVLSAGIGFGHDVKFNQRLAVSAEFSTQYLYLGNINDLHFLHRIGTAFQVKLFKPFTLFAGPAYNIYYRDLSGKGQSEQGFKKDIIPGKHNRFSNRTTGWLGWNAGITLF